MNQKIAHTFLNFPAIDEISLEFTYNEIFLYVRSLWSHGFLSDENVISYLKELKCFAVGFEEVDQFPEEADQFIFMLEGSEK